MKDVAAVILTCDQRDVTLRCLSSFAEASYGDLKILVWDNGSTDDTEAAVRSRFPNVAVRRSETNLGAFGGRNAGAGAAMELWSPEYLLFLDNDTVVTDGFLERLLVPFEEDARVAITTPKIRFLDRPDTIDSAGGCRVEMWRGQTPAIGSGELDEGQYDEPRDCVPGSCCILVRARPFEAVGGFDTAYDPFRLGDIDFSLRIRAAGYRSIYVPGALIHHAESQTFERGRYTSRYLHQKVRNWKLFLRRHADPLEAAGFWLVGAPLALLRAGFRELGRGNLRALSGLFSGVRRAVFGDRWGG